jgi:integrase
MNYVEPITDGRKIQAMSDYLKAHNRRDYLMFILGINIGLRISDMLDKSVGFFKRAAELGFVELVPKKTDKSKEAQMRRKGIIDAWGNNIGVPEENEDDVVLNRGGYRRKKVRVYMSDDVRELLRAETEDRNENDFMFESRNTGYGSKPITRQRAYDMLNEAAKAVGITDPIGTHSMRKTFGYWHYQKNHDVRMLMEIFGHSSEEITLKYIGVTNEAKRESAKGMNLGL